MRDSDSKVETSCKPSDVLEVLKSQDWTEDLLQYLVTVNELQLVFATR